MFGSCETVSSSKHRAEVESAWVKFAVRCDECHELGNHLSLKLQIKTQKLEGTDTGFEGNVLEVDICSLVG